MTLAHLLNISIHILAGTLAIVLGSFILFSPKASARHRRLGQVFLFLALIVCASAAIGTLLFRFIPVFAMLTLLVSYLCISGWRNIQNQAHGPQPIDAALLAAAVVILLALSPSIYEAASLSKAGATVLLSSLGALTIILCYDTVRHFVPKKWHAKLWRYEHIYRMLSALFGMLSAAMGNLMQILAAQVLPSIFGLSLILYFFWQERKRIQPQSIQ